MLFILFSRPGTRYRVIGRYDALQVSAQAVREAHANATAATRKRIDPTKEPLKAVTDLCSGIGLCA